jgi:hypothetical protein
MMLLKTRVRAFSVRFESGGFPKGCQCASLTALIRFGGNNAEAVFDGLARTGD